MNVYGIGLANGEQDIERVKSCGFHHYLALEGQIDYLQKCSHARYLRLMWKDFLQVPVNDLRDRILKWRGERHIIPWNEANYPPEQGESTYKAWNWVWQTDNYQRVSERYLLLQDSLWDTDVILHFPAFSPSFWYKECLGLWAPAANLAPVIDIHCYGSAKEMLATVDWYRQTFPNKKFLVTEFNFGAGNLVDTNWYADQAILFYDEIYKRPEVIAACGFIWYWHNPDTAIITTLNWEGQPIEERVRTVFKPERSNDMAWDRHVVFDTWNKIFGAQGFNPGDAFGKIINANPDKYYGAFVGGYHYEFDTNYIVAFTTVGIFWYDKRTGKADFATSETELPLV